jgi:hypothetical protein
MNLERLNEILDQTCASFRKGEKIVGNHFYGFPHVSTVEGRGDTELVDCHFIKVGVLKQKAEEVRAELIEILNEYPDLEQLKGGVSYIELGVVLGSQDRAFELLALGQVTHLWRVVTPATMGVTGEVADNMADMGFIFESGYSTNHEASHVSQEQD